MKTIIGWTTFGLVGGAVASFLAIYFEAPKMFIDHDFTTKFIAAGCFCGTVVGLLVGRYELLRRKRCSGSSR